MPKWCMFEENFPNTLRQTLDKWENNLRSNSMTVCMKYHATTATKLTLVRFLASLEQDWKSTKLRQRKHQKSFHAGQKKSSITREQNKSAIPTMSKTQIMSLTGRMQPYIKDREQNRLKRHIRESIWIRKQRHNSVNRNWGNYFLSAIYEQFLIKTAPPTSRSRVH